MHQYGFEKLNVWKNTRDLTKNIYIITKGFPSDEKFGLVSQMRRAVISISSNIAEGSSKKSKKDQANFYNIAYSSSMELLSQLILSNDLGYITELSLNSTRTNIELITNQLNALRNAITKNNNIS